MPSGEWPLQLLTAALTPPGMGRVTMGAISTGPYNGTGSNIWGPEKESPAGLSQPLSMTSLSLPG